jgi:hypothetical protein
MSVTLPRRSTAFVESAKRGSLPLRHCYCCTEKVIWSHTSGRHTGACTTQLVSKPSDSGTTSAFEHHLNAPPSRAWRTLSFSIPLFTRSVLEICFLSSTHLCGTSLYGARVTTWLRGLECPPIMRGSRMCAGHVPVWNSCVSISSYKSVVTYYARPSKR